MAFCFVPLVWQIQLQKRRNFRATIINGTVKHLFINYQSTNSLTSLFIILYSQYNTSSPILYSIFLFIHGKEVLPPPYSISLPGTVLKFVNAPEIFTIHLHRTWWLSLPLHQCPIFTHIYFYTAKKQNAFPYPTPFPLLFVILLPSLQSSLHPSHHEQSRWRHTSSSHSRTNWVPSTEFNI